jgi:hypothetical protein
LPELVRNAEESRNLSRQVLYEAPDSLLDAPCSGL